MKAYSIDECFGNKGCNNSIRKTEKLIKKLEEIIEKEKLASFIKDKCNGKILLHNTFRIGISNCPNACSQVHIKDFGIIQKIKPNFNENSCVLCGNCVKECLEKALTINKKLLFDNSRCIGCANCVKVCDKDSISIEKIGYSILIGGKLGRHPMLGIEVREFIESEDEIIEIFKKVIKFYKENNLHGERLGTIIQRIGVNKVLNILKGGYP